MLLILLLAVLIPYRPDRVLSYYLSEKREGDILFQSLPKGDLTNAIEGVSQSEWSHCGLLVRREGQWQVAEAIIDVRYTPLWQWLIRGRWSRVASYRPVKTEGVTADAIVTGVEAYLDLPYDYRYAPGEDEIYCSELVHLVYRNQCGQSLGTWETLGSLNWQPHEAFIREMEGGDLPLDRKMVTPVALTRDPQLEKIH